MKAVVSEINKVKNKTDNNQPGGIIDKNAIHISNLSFYDPELKKGIRIGYKIDKNKKTRVNKSSGKEI